MAADYYKVLGVKRNASQAEIKSAYLGLARKLHPDVSNEKDAEERMKSVNEAYAVIGDEKKRAEYDIESMSPEGFSFGSYPGTWSDDALKDILNSDMGAMFAEFTKGMKFDLHNPFGGLDFQYTEPAVNIPKNDWGLLNALQKAYESDTDGEWSVNRVAADKRTFLPRELYRVKRRNGEVTVFRTIKDLRDEARRETPIVTQETMPGSKKVEFSSSALFSEKYFTDEGRRKLTADSLAIPSGFDGYLRALHDVARKTSVKGSSWEMNFDIKSELAIINQFTEHSTSRYAEKGNVHHPNKETIESVPMKDFYQRLSTAEREVTDLKNRTVEGGWRGKER